MMKDFKYVLLVLLSSVLCTGTAISQITVSGTVTDQDQQPLIGVNVSVPGTTIGTVTDLNGSYSLDVPEETELLTFSYIGFDTREVEINDRTIIDITLEEAIFGINEVVAVGYGTAIRKNISTSIAKVDPTEIPVSSIENLSDLLYGRAAGLEVTKVSAQPGGEVDLAIRGRGNPLVIVDGVQIPFTGLEPGTNFSEIDNVVRGGLAGLNPSDIESVEVLKDASAAIYGVNAANGVILITTKKGRQGSIDINYRGSHSWVVNMPYLEPQTAEGYMKTFNRLSEDEYLAESDMVPFGPNPASGFVPRFSDADIAGAGKGTDWPSFILKNGSIENHNLTLRGGSERVTYYASGNFFSQEGTVISSSMRKYNGNLNLSFMLHERLTLNTKLTANTARHNNSVAGWQTGGAGANGFTALQAAYAYPAYLPVYDEYGELTRWQTTGNPISLTKMEDKTNQNHVLASATLDLEIIKNMLNARLLYGHNFESSYRDFYIPSDVYWFEIQQSRASKNWANRTTQTMEGTLNFHKNLSEIIDVDVVAGMAQYAYRDEGFGLNSQGMLDAIGTSDVGAGTVTPVVNSYKSSTKTRSYFTRANFDLLDRYLFMAAFRYDGYSLFFPDSKYAGFPSFSLGWKISNESFMRDFEALDLLKVRASWGTTGRTNLGSSAYAKYVPDALVISFDDGATRYIAYYQTALDNTGLKWEKTIVKNIGLDFAFLRNRIYGAFDLFRDDVTNILWTGAVTPPLSFIAGKPANGGHRVRTGWEGTINAHVIETSDFSWEITTNFTHYEHRWEKRWELDELGPYEKEKDPVNVMYVYETDGIIQLDDDIPVHQPPGGDVAGAPLYVDQNGDGLLDSADVIQLPTIPFLSFGFGNTFRYRNFDLAIFLYGQVGAYRRNNSLAWASAGTILGGGIAGTTDVKYVWSTENPDGFLPGRTYELSGAGLLVGDDVTITRADFLRVRNITLGYNFILPAVRKYVKSLRLYLDVQNAFVFTNYKGGDPEVYARGVKGGPAPYPMARTFSVGVSANF